MRESLRPAFAVLALLALSAAAQEAEEGAGAVGAPVQAGAGRLEVALEPESVTVGDRVRAELTLVWMGAEPAEAPRFPVWQETWGGAEILAAGEVEAEVDGSGRRIYRQELVLTAFRTGAIELPPVAVALPLADRTEELRSPAAGFEVASVLPEDAGEIAPRPAAPPRRLAGSSRFAWTAGLLALLVLAALWAMWRRLGAAGAGAAAARPRLEPLPELRERLERLEPAGASEPFHTGLSLALRDYLGRRLGFPALESTTSEIRRRLGGVAVAPEAARRAVELLRACDAVKFARLEVGADVARGRLEAARGLAETIEDGLRSLEEAAEPAREAA